jgi:hypothetical protein
LGRLLPSLPVRPSASVCSPGRSPQRPGPLGLTLPGSSIRVALTALGFGGLSGVGLRDHHHLPGRSICRPPRSRRTGRSATSREVFAFRVPSAFAGRAVPSRRRPTSGPSRCGVGSSPVNVRRPRRHRGLFKLALAVFGASRLRLLASRVRGDAARAGHSWPPFLRRTYRARGSGCYRGLADFLLGSRRRPWGSLMPFAVFIPSRA